MDTLTEQGGAPTVGPTPRWTTLRYHAVQQALIRTQKRFCTVPAGRRSGKCVAGGTLIAMADGTWRPVEAIEAGDEILTISRHFRLQAKPVRHVHDNGTRDTVVVRTAGRTLRCTANHPLLCNREWIEAGDISPGDLIAVPGSTPVFGGIAMDEDEVDFLAIWLAEGKDYTISNGSPEVVTIVERIASRWGLSIRHSGVVDMYLASGIRKGPKVIAHPARIFLASLGLWGANSKTKVIPECVFRLPKPQLARFLNLFFACDGCVYQRSSNGQPTVCLGLANERMVRQIAALLLKFGIRGQIRHKVHKAIGKNGRHYQSWDLSFSERDAVLAYCREIGALGKEDACNSAVAACMESSGSSNEYLPICIDDAVAALRPVRPGEPIATNHNAALPGVPREACAALKHWRKQSHKRCSTRLWERLEPWTDGRFDRLAHGDVAWEEVIAVEPAEPCQTWDLTVEGNHNFIAEGVVTHNTELSKRKLVISAAIGSPFPNPSFFAAAPTRDQAQRIFWEDLKALVPPHWLARAPSETHLEIRLVNGASIWVVGLDKPARIEGKAWDGGVITEIANCKPNAWSENIRPVMSDRRGWCWLEGVPEGRNFYYDLHEAALADDTGEWGAYHWTSEEILDPREIAAAKRDLDPLTYDQEYRASFVNFQGRAYYEFNRSDHARSRLPYNPRAPLIFCFDFNVAPGTASVLQECTLPNGLEGTAVIGEVWIPRNSNTPAVCAKLIEDWGDHDGRIMLYGDATGGARGTAKVAGSDWNLIERAMNTHYGAERVFPEVPRANPPERSRVNAMNTRIRNGANEVRFMVDPLKAPEVVKDFEGVTLLEGGAGQIDKKADAKRTHLSDGIGYYVHREFPVDSDRPTLIKTTGH